MKIGLLTIHNTQNYGSLLQTYSTYKALHKLGLDIDLIDYRNDAITRREKPNDLVESIFNIYNMVYCTECYLLS